MGKNKGNKAAAAEAEAPPPEIAPEPGFFGHVLKPGKSLVWDNEDEEFALQLTTAALGPKVTTGRSTLIAEVKDAKVALCTLIPEKTEQWNVSHLFTPYEGPVTFRNDGVNDIHLTGLIDVQEAHDHEGHHHGDDDDSDEEEDIEMTGTYSDSDDDGDVMVFEGSDDDDSDDDGEEEDDEEDDEGRFEVIEERIHGDVGEKKKGSKSAQKDVVRPKKESSPSKKEATPSKKGSNCEKKDGATPKKEVTSVKKESKEDVSKKTVPEKDADILGASGKKRPAPADAVDVPKKAKTTRLYKGVTIEEVAVGKGQPVSRGKKVSILYRGRLENGKQFDAQQNRKKPFIFRHGIGDVIKGMDIGIEGMRSGGKRTLTIPSHLGYGKKGAPPTIPGNSTLVFEIELL